MNKVHGRLRSQEIGPGMGGGPVVNVENRRSQDARDLMGGRVLRGGNDGWLAGWLGNW